MKGPDSKYKSLYLESVWLSNFKLRVSGRDTLQKPIFEYYLLNRHILNAAL